VLELSQNLLKAGFARQVLIEHQQNLCKGEAGWKIPRGFVEPAMGRHEIFSDYEWEYAVHGEQDEAVGWTRYEVCSCGIPFEEWVQDDCR